ncbi:hypothetical protein ARAM_003495 [Aspergillus rambellii]|uniref:DUF7702 domain-containing protein n=2 Tax=Aspergillus subgen. Nidulantes TaxID=2720870 RepID=A0A0F8UIX8_9EURO|nr:hypothetical protein ARAM_003495 [Aspergillus rambellii]KKK24342.1 hypothetical protein AOCH_005463 [Aspergillus ochraceoroseus]
MLTDHSKVAIAQIIFYIPVIVLAAILLFYRHGPPRLPWYILQIFCAVRVACGVVVILYENSPKSVNLYIAALVLLNAGLLPLIGATLGLLRLIIFYDFQSNKSLNLPMILSRILFLIGIALVISGGSVMGNTTEANSLTTGRALTKDGYIVVAIFMAVLIVFQGYFWTQYSRLSRPSVTILKGIALAVPFLIVRISWLFLSIYHPDDPRWSNLDGDIGPFVVMTAVMEYIVVWIYIGTGFMIPATKRVVDPASDPARETNLEPALEQGTLYAKIPSRDRV